jgi:glycosyltransferase involved in cell wall biosynthesis
MLVAWVIARMEPGGAQLGGLRLIRALRDHGITSRLFVGEANQGGQALLSQAEVEFEVWGGGEALQYACNRGFAEWLRPRLASADLVHAQMFGAWWAASEAVAPGVPLVGSEHNAIRWPGRPRWAEMRRALGRLDTCFAHGPAARATFLRLGLSPSRLQPGVSPIEPLSPHAIRRLPRPRLVFAGRLHPEKGPDLLLDALARLRPRVPAFLLGSGPLAPSLRARARTLGLARTVRLVGWQPRIGPWLAGATACVVPSRHESWSQTAVTAMAYRVPAVATAVEGLPLTLAEGRGVLVAPENPDELAGAIRAALAGRSGVDFAGAQRYAARFAPELVAARYANVYRRLCGRPTAAVADAA